MLTNTFAEMHIVNSDRFWKQFIIALITHYYTLHIITQHMHTWMQNFMYFCFFYVFLLYKYIDFRIYQEDVALGSEKTLWTILFTMNRVQIGVLI